MRRRSRVLRVAKWVGAVACGLLTAAAVANLLCSAMWVPLDGYGLGTGEGTIGVAVRVSQPWYGVGLTIRDPAKWQFWPPLEIFGATGELIIVTPLWLPILAIGVPTIVIWRLDRRPISGHCPCGYNLRGNVSGTCPECGRAATGKGDHARGDDTG